MDRDQKIKAAWLALTDLYPSLSKDKDNEAWLAQKVDECARALNLFMPQA